MPTPTSCSPSENTPFGSDEEHLRAHRALEVAIIDVDSSVATRTVSMQSLIATQVGIGGQVPGSSEAAAPIKGFYRTIATINVGVPAMSTTSAISTVVSVESQVGSTSPLQPGVPIIASPQEALPVGVAPGSAYCVNTNSITFNYYSITGETATTTVAYHVFFIDTIP